MGKADRVKVRDVVARLEADSWYRSRQRGDHRQYKHPTKHDTVTGPGHWNDDLPAGTLRSILRQAGLLDK